ncbi:hypothetical protein [uncultured Draconibacterium sp.]|uniref:hypothetical protein n=1 Tax=uncultured Draconibacterium sp. TaxID=1573823 RepID=UPI00321649A3
MKKRLYRFENNKVVKTDDYVVFKYDKIVYAKINCDYELGWSDGKPFKSQYTKNGNVMWNYSLFKLSKADVIYNTVNYQVIINELKGLCDCRYFVRLNPFEDFKLKWNKKETIFNRLKFYEKLLIIILGIAAIFIPIYCSNQNNEQTNAPNPSLKTNSQAIIEPSTKAPIHEIQNSKSDSSRLDFIK